LNNALVIITKDRPKALSSKAEKLPIDEGVSIGDSDSDVDMTEVQESPVVDYVPPESDTYVSSAEVHAMFVLLFEKESELLSLVYDSRSNRRGGKRIGPDIFFIQALAVPPNKFRPEARLGGGNDIAEATQNGHFKSILGHCENINIIRRDLSGESDDKSVGTPMVTPSRKRTMSELFQASVQLQEAINALVDKDKGAVQGMAARRVEDGIKQLLEKKEGLFRKNMMGKRVNFAARSVISPDPNIETNEIGVPPVFARKLTYPEPVTSHNVEDMRQAVINGPNKWPGAAAVESENGIVTSLKAKSLEQRQALAYSLLTPTNPDLSGSRNKKVHRHLVNGDIVLMNRQPTLHKPSIMAHKTRVLPGEKTIRMHYVNCNTYNADFDGDEMNMHFPQNEIARAEAFNIADTDHQYLSATAGKPLRGLIQDHISIGVALTSRDSMFDRESYHQLLYSCLRPEDGHTTTNRIQTVPPAIIKPKPLWTGKQVITTLLENLRPPSCPGLTLTTRSATPADSWGPLSEEGQVIFIDGYMATGILDKSQFGAAGNGMVHSVFEVYGHSTAGKLLSTLGRLLTKFLHMHAFSCGMEDLVFTTKGDQTRRLEKAKAKAVGLNAASTYVGMDADTTKNLDSQLQQRLEEVLRDDQKQATLDQVLTREVAKITTDVIDSTLPAHLIKPFPRNNMQAMTISGAKGSRVNASQISCLLGQQVLEGRRVPTMVSGKTLPSFQPYDTDVRAGGYILDRFLTGVRPQEYYFHCMAGREGLIDTAVKTSRSGYLQRCLVKGLEGLQVQYDTSVRDSDGSLVQFLYGEDGLDVAKQKHLTQYKFIVQNRESYKTQLSMDQEFARFNSDEAKNWSKEAMKMVRKTGRVDIMDPAISVFQPSTMLGSTSEIFVKSLRDYIDDNPDRLITSKKLGVKGVNKHYFEGIAYMKYLKSIIEPGEAVGIVAAQSIGEPSTQMTLNTFHLAGHASKNVTLGIPRLREIVMTASDHIALPTMTLPLNPELTDEECRRFAKGISRLSLAEVLDEVSVEEKVGPGIVHSMAKTYCIRLKLWPSEEYCKQYSIEVDTVLRAIELQFIPKLQRSVRAELKQKGDKVSAVASEAMPTVGEASGQIEQDTRVSGDGVDDEAGSEDGDASDEKRKGNQKEVVSYDDPDDDEENLAADLQRAQSPDEDMEDEGIGGSPKESSEVDASIMQPKLTKDARNRLNRIQNKNTDVSSFLFDDENGQWCELVLEYGAETSKIIMLHLVEKALREAVIQYIPGLGTCEFSEVETEVNGKQHTERVVFTEGVNVVAMRDYQNVINPHRLYTNDIATMLRVYGVEACRATIIKEMGAVFAGHSIDVNKRHLMLIGDVMTQGGGFVPFNRYGIASSTSPLLKMSFETTVGFLRDAAIERDWDDLSNPSARLVMGKLSGVGTGSFDVLDA
jgi:DNA-directed RNA polymerase I subunit RPA1